MEKSPAFQFYPKDFLTDSKVIAMTPEIRGLYITLLCIDWIDNGIKESQMLKLSGFEFYDKNGNPREKEDYGTAMALLSECFMAHPSRPGFLTNPRLQKERENQDERRKEKSEAGRKGADSRWKDNNNKELRKNGTAIVLPSLKNGTAIVLPMAKNGSSSSSSSSLDPTPHIPPPEKKINPKSKKQKKPIDKYFEFCEADFTFPEKWGAKSKQALKDWVDFKNQQGTAKLLISYQKEVDAFAQTPQKFFSLVYRAISKNWQGLNEQLPLAEGEDKPESLNSANKKYQVITGPNGEEMEVELVGGFHLGKK